jgi:hypothetical protein
MDAPALRKWEGLVAVRLGAEKRSDLIKDTTETRSCGKGFEPSGGPRALFNAPVVLLQMIIQVTVGPVRHPLPKDIPNGTWIGIMAIGGDALRRHPGYRPGRTKEGLGRREVACVAEPHIY